MGMLDVVRFKRFSTIRTGNHKVKCTHHLMLYLTVRIKEEECFKYQIILFMFFKFTYKDHSSSSQDLLTALSTMVGER